MQKKAVIGGVAAARSWSGSARWWAIDSQVEAQTTERGTCGGATWELSAEGEDGGTEVSAELQSSGPGEEWQVELLRDDTVAARPASAPPTRTARSTSTPTAPATPATRPTPSPSPPPTASPARPPSAPDPPRTHPTHPQHPRGEPHEEALIATTALLATAAPAPPSWSRPRPAPTSSAAAPAPVRRTSSTSTVSAAASRSTPTSTTPGSAASGRSRSATTARSPTSRTLRADDEGELDLDTFRRNTARQGHLQAHRDPGRRPARAR